MRGLLLILFLLLPSVLRAGEWSLVPAVIDNGGVALLRWQGAPPSVAVARFNGRVIYLTAGPDGAVALLGADVELPPGGYPVTVAVVDRRGRTELHRTSLQVRAADRPAERLSLPPAMVTPVDPAVLERIARERAMLKELFGQRSVSGRLGSFLLPVRDPPGSPFGLRRILNGKPRSPHAGVDFRSPMGTPVRSAARGKAVFAGELYYTGRTVILDHGEGLYTLYAHLDEIRCRAGQLLETGEVLGLVGSTGRSTGPHLHWGSKLRGDRVDPLALVGLLGEEKP